MSGTPRSIVLIGYMGSGKTTIGRLLSSETGYMLAEMDEILEERAGKSVREIFTEEGEEAFRLKEGELLAELASSDLPMVISTGGGIVLKESNLPLLRKAGFTVWLKASPETTAARLASDTSRPLLPAGADPEKIRLMLKEREPHYSRAADSVVRTDAVTPEAAAAVILEEFARRKQ